MRFDMICEASGIEPTRTRSRHPWTNGQVKRMSRTIKEATVKRFHYDSHNQLRGYLADYNSARRLKTLNGLAPYENICKVWTSEPDPPDAGTEHLARPSVSGSSKEGKSQ